MLQGCKGDKTRKMASVPSTTCPQKGCGFMVGGHDVEEVTEHMKLHMHSKHLNLGSLPNKILVKIIGYVVPDCEDCFQQREILQLRSVSRRFLELVKTAGFYRDIKLGYCGHHASPPISSVHKIIRTSGSQLKNIKCKLPQVRNAMRFHNFTRELSNMLANIQEQNPTSLTHLEMQTHNGDAKFNVTMESGKEPLFGRIQSLSVDVHDRFRQGLLDGLDVKWRKLVS